MAVSVPTLLMLPPPVVEPCDGAATVAITCADYDQRLADLGVALAAAAGAWGVDLVDLYDLFVNDPAFGIPPGSPGTLYRLDGVHLFLTTGDALVAEQVAAYILPEPGLLASLAAGAALLALRRRREGAAA